MPLTKEFLETGSLLNRYPSSVTPLPPPPPPSLLLCFLLFSLVAQTKLFYTLIGPLSSGFWSIGHLLWGGAVLSKLFESFNEIKDEKKKQKKTKPDVGYWNCPGHFEYDRKLIAWCACLFNVSTVICCACIFPRKKRSNSIEKCIEFQLIYHSKKTKITLISVISFSFWKWLREIKVKNCRHAIRLQSVKRCILIWHSEAVWNLISNTQWKTKLKKINNKNDV